jgi:hypothetical protein
VELAEQRQILLALARALDVDLTSLRLTPDGQPLGYVSTPQTIAMMARWNITLHDGASVYYREGLEKDLEIMRDKATAEARLSELLQVSLPSHKSAMCRSSTDMKGRDRR